MAALGAAIVSTARKYLGDPYVYGAEGPKSFDCSGLVQYVLKKVGVKDVPRTSEQQWKWSKHISKSELQPGDLIFEQWPGDNAPPGHVVIYIGGGRVIEAPHTGASVRIRKWSSSETTIVGYGRVPGSSGGGGDVPGTGTSAPTMQISDTSALPGASWLGKVPSAITGAASGIGDIGQALGHITTAIGTLEHWIAILFTPSFWLRVGAGMFGFTCLGMSLYFLKGAI